MTGDINIVTEVVSEPYEHYKIWWRNVEYKRPDGSLGSMPLSFLVRQEAEKVAVGYEFQTESQERI